jgi:hypothetical protein
VAVLGFPIGVINAVRISAIAAGPFATMQALKPTVQLGVLMIVAASTADDRQRSNTNDKRCTPTEIIHLTLNSGPGNIGERGSCRDMVRLKRHRFSVALLQLDAGGSDKSLSHRRLLGSVACR